MLIVSITVSAAVLGQSESSAPRTGCEWNPYTLEWDCPDPAPTATPTHAHPDARVARLADRLSDDDRRRRVDDGDG